MTVAEMIKQMRQKDNMTQEEFANRFCVSRQTVSSWETGKSQPDLQTLIDICNTYKISLDCLLNDDFEYVSKIGFLQKMQHLQKKIFLIIGIGVALYLLVFGFWVLKNKQMTKEFAQNTVASGYQLTNGHYEKIKENVTYILPNQVLPYMKFHFYAKYIDAEYRDGKDAWLIKISDTGSFSVDFGMIGDVSGEIAPTGEISYDKDSSEEAKFALEENKEKINEVVQELNEDYKLVYGY